MALKMADQGPLSGGGLNYRFRAVTKGLLKVIFKAWKV